MPSRNSATRKNVFEIYNKNLQLVLKDIGCSLGKVINGKTTETTDGYICPLCIKLFSEQDLLKSEPNHLSLEHIEPESIGGKKTVLTCKSCNNSAGSKVDYLLKSHVNRKLNFTIDGRFKLDDLSLKGRIEHNPELKRTNLVLNYNTKSKNYIEDKLEVFSRKSTSKEIQFEIKPENERRLICALLKIAHLKMFYIFGYGYLMNKASFKIAEQIRNPDKIIIEGIGYNESKDFFSENQEILFGRKDGIGFFLVKVNLAIENKIMHYEVFIPGPDEKDLKFYTNLRNHKTIGTTIEVDSKHKHIQDPRSFINFFHQ